MVLTWTGNHSCRKKWIRKRNVHENGTLTVFYNSWWQRVWRHRLWKAWQQTLKSQFYSSLGFVTIRRDRFISVEAGGVNKRCSLQCHKHDVVATIMHLYGQEPTENGFLRNNVILQVLRNDLWLFILTDCVVWRVVLIYTTGCLQIVRSDWNWS